MQQPPSQQQNVSPPPSGPISFDALSQAFKVLQSDIGYWAIISLILVLIALAIAVVGMFVVGAIGLGGAMAARGAGAAAVSLPVMMLGNIVVIILIIAITYALYAGYLNICVRRIAGEKTTVNDLFAGMSKVSQLFVAGVLVGLCVGIGSYLCFIPGLYCAAAFSMTPLLVLRQGMAPVDAMKKSMAVVNSGGPVMMILLILVSGICSELGAIACGIGVIFTMAIQPLTIAIVYKGFFPAD